MRVISAHGSEAREECKVALGVSRVKISQQELVSKGSGRIRIGRCVVSLLDNDRGHAVAIAIKQKREGEGFPLKLLFWRLGVRLLAQNVLCIAHPQLFSREKVTGMYGKASIA